MVAEYYRVVAQAAMVLPSLVATPTGQAAVLVGLQMVITVRYLVLVPLFALVANGLRQAASAAPVAVAQAAMPMAAMAAAAVATVVAQPLAVAAAAATAVVAAVPKVAQVVALQVAAAVRSTAAPFS